MPACLGLLLPLLLAWAAGTAQAAPVALVGATVHPVDGPPVADAVVVIDGTRVVAVGPRDAVAVPAGATVHDLTGKVIIPGLVDLHSHVGGGRLHEHLAVAQPGVAAVDAVDPSHVSIRRARAGGVTTANVMPGSGKLIGGQTAYLALVDADTVDEMLRCPAPEGQAVAEAEVETEAQGPLRRTAVCGGMKFANGTNPQGDAGGDPASRMGSAWLQRKALLQGAARLRVVEQGGDLDPDLDADALVQVLRGERRVHFHSHRADDIVTAVRLQQEFGFRLVLHHGSEGYEVAELLAEAGVPVAVNVLDTPGGKEETLDRRLENPAWLHAAGVTVALISDDPVQDSRLLLRTGGLAVRGGLPPGIALRALTLTPAELMGLDDEIGSLTPGKQADLVVLSGPPLSTWTHVEETWVAGERLYDRSDPAQRAVAVGGDGTWRTLGETP